MIDKQQLQLIFPGITVTVITGLAALFLSEHYTAPAMLFALLLGIAVSFLYQDKQCMPGIDFCATHLLRIGVALLGLRIALDDLFSLGWQTIVLLAIAIATTIVIGLVLSRLMKLELSLGALTGGSVAICGASAAMAITAILPNHPNKERNTLLTVIGVTGMSTLAMVIYPIIATKLQLTQQQAGLFLGGTIHDVAQVVGAGFSISDETGDLSTLVKLVRVSMLMPVVFIMMLLIKHYSDNPKQSEKVSTFPAFLLAFIALLLINSLFDIPQSITDTSTYISRFALITAIAAIGMKSNLAQLKTLGMKPIMLILAETIWIAAFILLSIKFYL